MKKMFLSALACVAFAGSVFANNVEEGKTNEDKQQATTETVAEEALYCEVTTANGGSVSCWVCDCNELAKTVSKGGNNSGSQNQTGVGFGRP